MKYKNFFFFVILIFFLFLTAENKQNKYIQNLEKQLLTATGIERVKILNQMTNKFYRINPEKSLQYSKMAIDLSNKIGYPEGKAYAFIYSSYANCLLQNRQKAFKMMKDSLKIFENLNNKKGISDANHGFGMLYYYLKEWEKALKFELQALRISEQLKDKTRIADIYYSIGIIYINQKDPKKGLDYFQKSLKLANETGNKMQMALSLNNIGIAYRKLEEYNLQLNYYKRALMIFQEIGNKRWKSKMNLNIGVAYLDLKKYDKSLKYLQVAYKEYKKIDDKISICKTSFNIAHLYIQTKKYKKALLYIREALSLAKTLGDRVSLRDTYKIYSDLYFAMGNFREALMYYKLHTEIKDALINEEKNKQFTQYQEKFEAEKRERQIKLLEKTNQIQKMTRNFLITGLVVALIILIIIVKKYLYLFTFWRTQKYVEHYKLIEKLGIGAYGTVWRSINTKDKSIFAIKILNENILDESSIKRFKYEGIVIDSLNHPNIIKIIQRGEYKIKKSNKSKLFIVMEYLNGITLDEKIEKQSPIPLNDCYHIAEQITDALSYIHSKSIIHRDLKPRNIFLINKNGDSNFVKLLDFGLAKSAFFSKMTRTGMVIGTTSYISPEQAISGNTSTKSDVFSLGLIFYEIFTGKHPFPRNNYKNETLLVKAIVEDESEEANKIRKEIPVELNNIIMKMLLKDPKKRPKAIDVLKIFKEFI